MPRRSVRAIKHGPKSDPQQYRVYRMEAETIGSGGYVSLSRETLRRFARAICRQYGIPCPRIVFTDLGKWAAEWAPPEKGTKCTISINPFKKGSLDLVVLAHELAHHLHNVIAFDKEHEPHGPQFMACYMSILDTGRIIPTVAMEAVCKLYGVKFTRPGTTAASLARRVRARR